MGETVSGVLTNQTPRIAVDLTAPANGILVVNVSWDLRDGGLEIWFEDDPYGGGFYWGSPAIQAEHVFAGGTYRLMIAEIESWDYLIGEFSKPFVFTSSLEPVIPLVCESSKPAPDWLCVNGGWLPLGHPLLDSPFISPPIQPAAVAPQPPAPSAGCATPDPFLGIPGMLGLCVNGGWVPYNHPLALGSQPAVQQPSAPPAPAPSAGCATPDPFLGIPGLFGVCVNGGWVPVGHPLAGGGG